MCTRTGTESVDRFMRRRNAKLILAARHFVVWAGSFVVVGAGTNLFMFDILRGPEQNVARYVYATTACSAAVGRRRPHRYPTPKTY